MRSLVPAGRVVGLDIARCLALLGMMATHVLPGVEDGEVTAVQELAGGRASALFAVLAGASLALMSGRATPVQGRERTAVATGLAVRALMIAVLGLMLAELDSGIAIILTNYGVLFLLGIPFLGLRARGLVILAACWVVVVPVLSHLLRPRLPPRDYQSPNFGQLGDPWQLLSELLFTGYYPVVPWLAYLFAGMALGRLDLARTKTAVTVWATGVAVAAASWLTSDALLERPGVLRTLARTFTGVDQGLSLPETLDRGLYGTTPTGSWWWLAVRAPHSATPFDLAHTIGSALLVIGLCVLFGRVLPSLTSVLFGAGAMTLTLYSLHVLLRTPPLWSGDDYPTYLEHVVLVLVLGAVFRLARTRGPLEAVAGTSADGARLMVRR